MQQPDPKLETKDGRVWVRQWLMVDSRPVAEHLIPADLQQVWEEILAKAGAVTRYQSSLTAKLKLPGDQWFAGELPAELPTGDGKAGGQ